MYNIYFKNVKDITVVIKRKYAVNFANEIRTKFKFKNVVEINLQKDKVYIYQINENADLTPYFFKSHIAYIEVNDQKITF